MKNLLILFISVLAISFNSYSSDVVEETFSCTIEGHGGGCGNQYVKLKVVPGAVSYKAVITEEYGCFEDEYEDFCSTRTFSEYETSERVDLLKLALDTRDEGLVVKPGYNQIRVTFYDANGSYITSQIVSLRATYNEIY